MSEFWLWFWKPIAELLGALALAVALVALVFVGMIGVALYQRWHSKWKDRRYRPARIDKRR